MNPVVIFFHIPKAAGTSIREQIAIQLKPVSSLYISDISEIAYMSNTSLNRFDFISGHVGIQLLNRIERPAVKLTFLRDPVTRVQSQYQYLRKLAAMDVSFNGYKSLLRDRSLKELLHDKSDPLINSWFRDTQCWTLVRDYQHHYRYLDMAHSEVLDIAKENLNNIDCFGIVEFMDESFDLLNAKFGWSLINNIKENISVYSKEPGDNYDTDEIIKEQNRLDVELYAWACSRFKQQADGKTQPSSLMVHMAEHKVSAADNKNCATSNSVVEATNYHVLPKELLIERIQRAEEAMSQSQRLVEHYKKLLIEEKQITAQLRASAKKFN